MFLGKHKLKQELNPILAIKIGSREELRLKFTLELMAEFKSARLDIRGGQIIAIGAGECSVDMQLKYGQHNLHPAINLAKIELPAERKLKSPLSINRNAQGQGSQASPDRRD